jgi:transposase-like protein
MRRSYQVAERKDSQALTEFLASEGQLLLPMVQLIEDAELAVDEVIDMVGRATIEAVLQLSAEQVAGRKQRGKRGPNGKASWHGSQPGVVSLAERKLRVTKPRLREKGVGRGGEVEVPAYEAMRGSGRLGERMLEILLSGVSTRRYKDVLPEMANAVGISKSQVSRETIEAGERVLRDLAERHFEDKDLLIIYIDGVQFGSHHVLAAVGVDAKGRKHVLGLREGASENAIVVVGLLEELVERGVKPDRRRLFVIDGAKALRKAIDQVYGSQNPIQRCRNHKIRNVLGHLPDEQQDQVNSAMRAAFKLDATEGMKRLEQLALWLERDHPSAAASLREGLSEMFTINRLGLPAELRRCLGSTNLIDSTHSGVRQKTKRITNWQSGSMVLRWAAAAFLATEQRYRRILGYRQLWILKAHLDRAGQQQEVADERKAG